MRLAAWILAAVALNTPLQAAESENLAVEAMQEYMDFALRVAGMDNVLVLQTGLNGWAENASYLPK